MRSTGISQSKVVFVLGMLCLLVGVAFSSPLAAQEKSGALTGVITDDSGAVLPGVTVTLTNKETGRSQTIISGSDGTYQARTVDPGRYSVKFALPGFSALDYPDVSVLLGQSIKLDAKMKVGGVTTTVEVSEAAPMIDTQSTLVAHNVPAEQFDRLPKSRTFQYFAVTSPSVNSGDIEGGIQINGASGAENNYTVDGISTNSIIYGSSRQNAAFEYLQEVQIKSTGIEAEYGGALGGVISAVTKSGGNVFHGDVHYYFQGSALSAAPVRRLVLDPFDDLTVIYVQDKKPLRKVNEFGFTLSGPLVKDKVFYFASVSPQWTKTTRTYNFSPSAGLRYSDVDTYSQTQTGQSAFGKLSIDPSNKVRTNWTYLWSPSMSTGAFLAHGGTQPNGNVQTRASNESNKTRGFFQPQSNVSGNVDYIASNNVLIQGKGTFRWDNYKDTGIPNIPGITYRSTNIGLAGVPASLQGGVGFTNTSQVSQTFFDATSTVQGQVDVSVSGNWFGFHNFKGGAGISKFVNRVNTGRNGGVYIDVYWDRAFTSLTPGVGAGRGTYGYYEVNTIGTVGSTGAGIKNFYAQDSWAVNKHLTLNLGMRTEQERIPSFRRDLKNYAVDFSYRDKFAPRLGAAYDVNGDGKIKLSGSWGRYYDWTKYELVRGSFGGDTWRIRYLSLDTTDVFSLSKSNTPGRDLWNPSVPNSFRDRRVPSFDTIAPGLKPMYQDKINFGMEYQWNARTVIGARVIHDDLKETIEDLGALDANGDEVYLLANPGIGAGKVGAPTGLTSKFDWPRPKRQYDALELTVNRSFSKGWSGNASYVISRLYGNYSGLANSDEIRTPTTGRSSATAQQQGGSLARPGSNVSRAWDADEIVLDSKGHLDLLGRLATDRPHVVKFNGQYEFNNKALHGDTNFGAFFYAGSGTPISTQVWTRNQIPVMVNGRGDRGRTPMLSYTDLVVSHTVRMDETKRLRFELNLLNAFNQKTTRNIFPFINRGSNGADSASAINLANTDLKKGYDYMALIGATSNGATKALDPRLGKADLFNAGLAGRFGMKFTW